MSTIARSMSSAEGPLDRLGAVAGLCDHLQVGRLVEHHPQPATDDCVIVGEQDPGLEWSRAHRSSSSGTSRRTSQPWRSGPLETVSVAPDERRSFAHPAHPRAGRVAGRQPTAVIGYRQHQPPVVGDKVDLGLVAARVAGHVGQRLLGDAVDDQLGVGAELGHVGRYPLDDVERRALGEALAEYGQGADQAEVVERLRPQLDRDPANVLEAHPDLLLDLHDIVAQGLGDAVLQAGEHEQHGSQLLTHLVVELLRDPQALGLLPGQHPTGGLAALGLEPVEHLVERQRELAGLRRRLRPRHPLPGFGEVDSPGEIGQRLQRTHDPAQQEQVHQRHQQQRRDQDRHLLGGERRDPARLEHEDRHHDRGDQQQCVDAGHAHHERHIAATRAERAGLPVGLLRRRCGRRQRSDVHRGLQ